VAVSRQHETHEKEAHRRSAALWTWL